MQSSPTRKLVSIQCEVFCSRRLAAAAPEKIVVAWRNNTGSATNKPSGAPGQRGSNRMRARPLELTGVNRSSFRPCSPRRGKRNRSVSARSGLSILHKSTLALCDELWGRQLPVTCARTCFRPSASRLPQTIRDQAARGKDCRRRPSRPPRPPARNRLSGSIRSADK
jgi:hypothetical protein